VAARDECNGGEVEGAFLTVTNQRNGLRCSTEKAFLRPNRTRANLRIMTNAAQRRSSSAAAGPPESSSSGMAKHCGSMRDGKSIVSAGAIGSPALLMRSGQSDLETICAILGIEVRLERSEIGRNLQEHPAAGQSRLVNVPSLKQPDPPPQT